MRYKVSNFAKPTPESIEPNPNRHRPHSITKVLLGLHQGKLSQGCAKNTNNFEPMSTELDES